MSGTGAPERPLIAVYATGGTIAATPHDGGPVSPSFSALRLADTVPHLQSLAELRLVDFLQVPSVELTLVDVVSLVERFRADALDGVQGFVVTQGTDSLEECAFAIDLMWDLPQPVVVTGAMRPPLATGADGPANLLAAVQVACSPQARDAGCLVVLNDEIHAARHVRKAHTTGLGAFQSPGAGPVGGVTEGRAALWSRPSRRTLPEPPSAGGSQPPVALLRVGLGDDGRGIGALAGQGFRGVVVEAMGGGHVPSRLVEPLAALSSHMPVVLASRIGVGEILRRTYGFPGSETELLAGGLIHAGALDGLKARVKLALLLMAGAGKEDVRQAFAAEGGQAARLQLGGAGA